MHAVVATVRVDHPEEVRKLLETARVEVVKRAPGLVSAYWLEPVNSIGMSVLVFETRDNAEAATSYPLPPIPGVTPLSLEIREVYARVGP